MKVFIEVRALVVSCFAFSSRRTGQYIVETVKLSDAAWMVTFGCSLTKLKSVGTMTFISE